MNKKIVLLAVVAIAGYVIYKRAMRFVDKLSYSVEKIKFDFNSSLQSNFQRLIFSVQTKLINPENVRVRVSNISLFFAINDKTFAQIVQVDPFIIQPKKSMPITFPLEINVQSIPTALKDAFKNFVSGQLQIRVFGKLDTDFGTIKFDEIKKLI